MKIAEKKREKISEQILALLYSIAPRAIFTAEIAREIARDEEFVKKILLDLERKGLVVEIKKNFNGVLYLKRVRWRLGNRVYEVYKKNQKEFY